MSWSTPNPTSDPRLTREREKPFLDSEFWWYSLKVHHEIRTHTWKTVAQQMGSLNRTLSRDALFDDNFSSDIRDVVMMELREILN